MANSHGIMDDKKSFPFYRCCCLLSTASTKDRAYFDLENNGPISHLAGLQQSSSRSAKRRVNAFHSSRKKGAAPNEAALTKERLRSQVCEDGMQERAGVGHCGALSWGVEKETLTYSHIFRNGFESGISSQSP